MQLKKWSTIIESFGKIKKSLEWRKMNEMDKICDSYTPPEVYPKYFAVGHMGIDKFGCPGKIIRGIDKK